MRETRSARPPPRSCCTRARRRSATLMHRHHRFVWVLGLAAGLAVATCQFPTDKSDEVYVVLTPSDTLLARGVIGQGQTDQIFAQTWRRLPNGDSAEVLNVDYHWSSDNDAIARVERRSGG